MRKAFMFMALSIVTILSISALSFEELLAAARSGDVSAQVAVGAAYHDGAGVAQDFAESVRWYREAAASGDAEAQFQLGVAYGKGDGVDWDEEEMARWYRLAADQGHAKAMLWLGLSYSMGWGVPEDVVESYLWLSLSALRSPADGVAVNLRSELSKGMTAEQVAQAQKRVLERQAGIVADPEGR